MAMKMRLKIKNRTHGEGRRNDINRPRSTHGHKYTWYNDGHICIKQHLSNI